jgi:ABC-type Fe3+/spermidine/putrescine transport system ATPase subunit
VDSAWGTLPIRSENVMLPPADARGARGLAVVRPEHLRILDGPAGPNALAVATTVTQSLYNGSETIYRATCRVAQLSLMLIDKRPNGRIHDIGAEMHVELDPAHLVVVPEPGGPP